MSYKGCILHVISVGFHHRKGATVEFAYPPFAKNVNGSECESENIVVPAKWKHLTALALPDGAHNYLKDTVYFTLPSLEKDECAVFGIASYRQADSTSFSQPTPEHTRNTVQKSLVVLTRFPLFSLIAHELSAVAESLFLNGGFTPERLQAVYSDLEERINAVFNSPSTYQDALVVNLSAANFVRVYGRDALTCFKLVLLERRILFDGESAGWMCNWILTLLSLFPDLIAHGLTHSAFVDPSWVTDRACWAWPSSVSQVSTQAETRDQNPSASNRLTLDERVLSSYPSTGLPLEGSSAISTTAPSEAPPFVSHGLLKSANSNNVKPDQRPLESTGIPDLSQLDESHATRTHHRSLSDLEFGSDVLEMEPQPEPLNPPDPLPVPDTPFATDHWGFPLALFTKSNIVPLYAPLGCLDVLLEWVSDDHQGIRDTASTGRSRSVRGFLAGATNPLLRTHKQLAEVIVTTLSPTDGLADPRVLHPPPPPDHHQQSVELTSLFEKKLKPAGTGTSDVSDGSVDKSSNAATRSSGSQSKGFNLPRRTPPVIRICPNDSSLADLRPMPASLAQALQLSRLDRMFVDELVRTVLLWYQAKTQLLESSGNTDISEVLAQDENADAVDRYLFGLTPPQKTVLLRFPTSSILDTWIRQQFQSYLRALLLTAEGYNSNVADFNSAYIACLRSARCFLVWRGQFVPTKVFAVSSPKGMKEEDVAAPLSTQDSNQTSMPRMVGVSATPNAETANHSDRLENRQLRSEAGLEQPSAQITDVPAESASLYSVPSATASVIALLSQHPGRRYMDSDDWEQLVDGFKRFGNLAADRGRRLMNQGMLGLNKLSSEFQASWRSNGASSSGGSAGVISKFSDAFKSFLGGGGGTTSNSSSN